MLCCISLVPRLSAQLICEVCVVFEDCLESFILYEPSKFNTRIHTHTHAHTHTHTHTHTHSHTHTAQSSPFFLYMAFQHTHRPQFAEKMFTNSSIRGRFGDALAELDWGVGQILEALKLAGVEENTFVFFTSDNG